MVRMLTMTLLLGWSWCAQAQFTIQGIVRDANEKRALAGATVQCTGTSLAAVTDEYGMFRFDKVKAGEYYLVVNFLGYSTSFDTLNITSDSKTEILLKEQSVLTDEVVVLATRANEHTPTTFTNVNRLTIQKQNFGQDLPFIVNWTPSVVTTSDAGAGVGYTGIRIRGSDATRVNVTINGIPYNDSESQGTFWVDIPDIASSTQSIQIQRGVGTSTNGAGAFGGTVNLQTNSLQAEPYAEILTSAGSFSTFRNTLRAGTGLINNHWAFDAKVSRITSDGYVERASSDLGSYYLSGGYYGKKTVIKAITFGGTEKTYQSWYGVDSATMAMNRRMNYAGAIYDANGNIVRYYDNQVDDYKQDHYQLHISQQLGKVWTANLSLHYTWGRGYYEEYHQNTAFKDLGLPDIILKDTTLTSSDVILRKWLDNKFYGATWSAQYNGDRSTLIFGGAYNQYADAKHFGEVIWAQFAGDTPIRYRYYNGEAQKNDFNTYVKWSYNIIEKLSSFIDVQYRHVTYRTSGTKDDLSAYDVNDQFNFFNPKAGLNYAVTGRDMLYTSYAIANREPNRSDYIDGTVKPRPERLDNFELGWRRNASRYGLEVNYYLMNYTDQLVLTGQLDNAGYPIRANVGKSYRTGLELSGLIRISGQWTWNANLTWSMNKNRNFVVLENNVPVTKDTNIILSPGLIGGSQLTWAPVSNFQATILSKYVGKQYLDNDQNERLTLPSYFINDVRLSYQWKPGGMKEVGFNLLLNNIGNVLYASNGYSYAGAAYYYPQAGRNFLFMITLKF
ncbi:MAG: TonB-dependent receptor [Bacteroidetes bacterium]|nr:TonB-dependent receptor [Bacteroidota bacterium]